VNLRSAAACRRFRAGSLLPAGRSKLRPESGAKAPHSKGWLALAILAWPQIASACPVCFGGPDSISKGMDTAILFLLSIVGLVQIGFVALFWSFRRRAKELQKHREQFHLIEGGLH